MGNACGAQSKHHLELSQKLCAALQHWVPKSALKSMGVRSIAQVFGGMCVEVAQTSLVLKIQRFSQFAKQFSQSTELFDWMQTYFAQMHKIVVNDHRGRIDRFEGDGTLVCIFPMPTDAIQCSLALLREVDHFNVSSRDSVGFVPLRVACCMDYGVYVLGVLGDGSNNVRNEKGSYDYSGSDDDSDESVSFVVEEDSQQKAKRPVSFGSSSSSSSTMPATNFHLLMTSADITFNNQVLSSFLPSLLPKNNSTSGSSSSSRIFCSESVWSNIDVDTVTSAGYVIEPCAELVEEEEDVEDGAASNSNSNSNKKVYCLYRKSDDDVDRNNCSGTQEEKQTKEGEEEDSPHRHVRFHLLPNSVFSSQSSLSSPSTAGRSSAASAAAAAAAAADRVSAVASDNTDDSDDFTTTATNAARSLLSSSSRILPPTSASRKTATPAVDPDTKIDAAFLSATLTGHSDSDTTLVEWLQVLRKEEVRTVADLRVLTDADWGNLALPRVVRRRLQNAI